MIKGLFILVAGQLGKRDSSVSEISPRSYISVKNSFAFIWPSGLAGLARSRSKEARSQ